MQPNEHQVTVLIQQWAAGDATALDELIPLVYSDLRRHASRLLRKEPRGTMQCTALVHELYLRLLSQRDLRLVNRAHFLSITARLMRHILIDHARRKQTGKRGGDAMRVPLTADIAGESGRDPVDLIALDEALTEFAGIDRRKSEIVELRYFGGLSFTDVAALLEVSPATVKRDWAVARLWLLRRIRSAGNGS